MSRLGIASLLIFAALACSDTVPTAPDPDPRTAPEMGDINLQLDGDPCTAERSPSAPEVVVPSPEHRSIQGAVCAVMDGGTVHVLAGTYSEPITIWGKRVTIRGAGNENRPDRWPVLQAPVPTEVVSAREAEGVITVGGGGGLSLRMVRVVGGDVGVLALDTSGPVEVKHAVLEQNGRGILHFSSAELSIKHTTFTGQLWNGISFVPFDLTAQNCGGVDVSHGLFGSTGGAGIYVRGCFHTIEHTSIDFAQGGGIVAIASVITVREVNVAFATYFGILVVNTAAHIEGTDIDFTKEGPLPPNPDPVYGDAISVWSTNAPWAQGGSKPSFAYVKNNSTSFSDRAALSNFGGHVDLKNNLFGNQAFDIEAETYDGYPPSFTDLGGNVCLPGAPPDNHCISASYSLPAPPDVGGLE